MKSTKNKLKKIVELRYTKHTDLPGFSDSSDPLVTQQPLNITPETPGTDAPDLIPPSKEISQERPAGD